MLAGVQAMAVNGVGTARKAKGKSTKRERMALLRAATEAKRQAWREARRALLADFPCGVEWFVALVSGGREGRAERAFGEAGFHGYCPVERVTIGTGAGRRDVERPLFPRYVFFARRQPGADLKQVRDVTCVLTGAGGQWSRAPARLIAGLVDSERLAVFDRTDARRDAVRKARRATLSKGDRVTIGTGPLSGFPARIIAIKADSRVECLIRFLGGETTATLDVDSVEIAA